MSTRSYKRIGLVTGGNKGIGLEIARKLVSDGVTVVLTARDEKRGLQAVDELRRRACGTADLDFHQLDVADPVSVSALAEYLDTKYGRLDILVNNAGVGGLITPEEVDPPPEGKRELATEVGRLMKALTASAETVEVAMETIEVNYFGTKRVTESLIHLLQHSPWPRIVNITSIFGKLEFIPGESIRKELDDPDRLTEERLDEIVREFLKDFEELKDVKEKGWPENVSAYKVSKAAANAYTRILAKRHSGSSFSINAVHPGFVRSDMTYDIGTIDTEEGARGPAMLALLPDDSCNVITGLFYEETTAASF